MFSQIRLDQVLSPLCPFLEFLDKEDTHCNNIGFEPGYDYLSDNDPRLGHCLADIKNIGFGDIEALPVALFELPCFIPTAPRGSGKLFKSNHIPVVAVTLADIIDRSADKIRITDNVREKIGVDKKTKLILLCYGKDELIEKIWPIRHEIFDQIKKSGFDLVTAINYSIWLNQPHAERLVNLKRSLVTFKEMQHSDIRAIPHIYWSGKKDIERWADWLNKNVAVEVVAINLQTIRNDQKLWKRNLTELKYFVSLLNRPVKFLISGPSSFKRVSAIKEIISDFILTNSACMLKAINHRIIKKGNDDCTSFTLSDKRINYIAKKNIEIYSNFMS